MIFDDILAGCIEALEQGATIEECLARYPAQAAALEPLLRVVVVLRSEAQTRMSSQAFARGRSALRQRAQQMLPPGSKVVQHRLPSHLPPPRAMPPQERKTDRLPHGQNGATQPRRPLAAKRSLVAKQSGWGRAMARILSTALLLVLLLGATSLTRRVISSLPGTFFYPIKNVGEQGVGVLMQAAGEEIPWHANQAEDRLQELAQLSQPETVTVQALVKVIEEHWESVLTASQRLPLAERILVLQSRITRLQQIEAEWASPQTAISPTAVLTVRKMITAGEQLLVASQVIETATPTASLTPVPATVVTIVPTTLPTATPLLQATLTLTSSPILVGTATPEATSIELSIPATATPSPTLLATVPPATTPIPVITAQMPLQESSSQESNSQESTDQTSNSQGSDDGDADEDKNNLGEPEQAVSGPETNQANSLTAEATASTPESEATLQTPESVITIDATVIAPIDPTVDPTVATLSVTPVIGEPPSTPVETVEEEESPPENETPPAPAPVESTPSAPGKGTPSAPATPELLATETARPTNQPAATKTPKPTATPDKPDATAPDKTTVSTPIATPMEKTPKPTAQPTVQPTETPVSAPIPPITPQSITPRPPSPSGEATKVEQP